MTYGWRCTASSALSSLLGPHGVFGLAVSIFKSGSLAILRVVRYLVIRRQATHTLYLFLTLDGCLYGRIR